MSKENPDHDNTFGGDHFDKMFGHARETIEREELIKGMLKMLPPELIPGFIADQLESLNKTLQVVDEAISRFETLKEAEAVKSFNIWRGKLLEQKLLLLNKQK